MSRSGFGVSGIYCATQWEMDPVKEITHGVTEDDRVSTRTGLNTCFLLNGSPKPSHLPPPLLSLFLVVVVELPSLFNFFTACTEDIPGYGGPGVSRWTNGSALYFFISTFNS